jgi:hypothetical protein
MRVWFSNRPVLQVDAVDAEHTGARRIAGSGTAGTNCWIPFVSAGSVAALRATALAIAAKQNEYTIASAELCRGNDSAAPALKT